jgi:polar amino acid transport system substrate-binding protein
MKLVPQLLSFGLVILLGVLGFNQNPGLASGLPNHDFQAMISGYPAWFTRVRLPVSHFPSILVGQLSSPQSNPGHFVSLGSEGKNVEVVQTQLKTLGYYSGAITGFFDEQTKEAVESFQEHRGLQPDGIVGATTIRQLQGQDGDSHFLTTSATPMRSQLPLDIQRIKNRGKLVVAILGNDNPPFFMVASDGTLEGLDVKIAQGIAEALEVDVEFNRSATTFNEVVDEVYNLNADIAISKLSRTLKRGTKVRFSIPYIRMHQGLLVNRLQLAEQSQGRSVIETIRDLQGKVGVIEGSSYVGFLQQKFPKATIEGYPTWEDIVAAVSQGDILAGYRDELEVKKIVLGKPDAALKLQTIALTDTEDPIAMAFPWDSTHFIAFVDQYLDTLKLEYTADLVLEEYGNYFQSP